MLVQTAWKHPEGIAQEVGVDINELKVVLVGDETQLDVKPFQLLRGQYHQIEWDYEDFSDLASRANIHEASCGNQAQE